MEASNPIKEIIFSISFADDLSLDLLKKFSQLDEIMGKFPSVKAGYKANLKATDEDTPPTPDIQETGYIMKCDEPCNRIIHAKRGIFTFHKTKEYEAYDSLINELDFYWGKLQECTKILTVTSVSLRYLNFIEITEEEDVNSVITINTKHPFSTVKNNFNQLSFNSSEDDTVNVRVVVANSSDNGKTGIVLDIILNRKVPGKKFDSIKEAFEGMKRIKNEIFQLSISEKTKNKYNI